MLNVSVNFWISVCDAFCGSVFHAQVLEVSDCMSERLPIFLLLMEYRRQDQMLPKMSRSWLGLLGVATWWSTGGFKFVYLAFISHSVTRSKSAKLLCVAVINPDDWVQSNTKVPLYNGQTERDGTEMAHLPCIREASGSKPNRLPVDLYLCGLPLCRVEWAVLRWLWIITC